MNHPRRWRTMAVTYAAMITLTGCGGNALLPGNDSPHIDKILVNGVAGAFSDVDATSTTSVATNSKLELVCQAADSNRDPLTYQWSTTGAAGTLTSTGDSNIATLNVTTDGDTVVACTVSDGRGGVNSRSVRIRATTTTNNPPTLKLVAAPITVAANGSVTLTATASDPDGDKLSYAYSVIPTGDGPAAGVLTQDVTDKSKAVYVAPGTAGTVLILCVVSDGKGGSAARTSLIMITAP